MTEPAQNPPTKEEIDAFFKALELSNFDAVRKTVEARPDAPNWKSADGFAPMHWAILESHQTEPHGMIGLYLIEHGADLNSMQPVEHGCPLIPYAISWGANEIALRLVEAGADITWKTTTSSIPEAATGNTFLMSAAGWGVLDVARALLDRGADINARDDHGKTAIMNAAWSGKGEMVEFLASRGASLEGLTTDGDDITSLAKKEHRQRALPSLEDVFRRIDADADCARTGLDRPVGVSSKPLQFKNRVQFLRV